jgi:hypothetical protein
VQAHRRSRNARSKRSSNRRAGICVTTRCHGQICDVIDRTAAARSRCLRRDAFCAACRAAHFSHDPASAMELIERRPRHPLAVVASFDLPLGAAALARARGVLAPECCIRRPVRWRRPLLRPGTVPSSSRFERVYVQAFGGRRRALGTRQASSASSSDAPGGLRATDSGSSARACGSMLTGGLTNNYLDYWHKSI